MDTTRTAMLIGADGIEKLKVCRVLVAGLGGVGGACAEALTRAGVGSLTLVDGDTVSASNLNRQIFATADTIGKRKTDAARERLLSINPELCLETLPEFWTAERIGSLNLDAWDFVVDAIDTVSAKIAFAVAAERDGARLISCMGSGNKLSAEFEFADIYATSVCPLARVMRAELKRRGVKRLAVVYSKSPASKTTLDDHGRHAPGSIAYAPAIAGLKAAEYAIRTVLGEKL